MEAAIRINGYLFNYKFVGNPLNFPILFLHGFMGSCHDFDEAMSLLSNNFYCLAVDIPGHGKTRVAGGKESYRIESVAKGIVSLLDALEISQCILIGYSMGGRLALYLTLYFPEYFQKVVLESASPGLTTDRERTERIENDLRLAQALEMKDFSIFLKKWYEQPLFHSIKRHPNFEKMLGRRLVNNPPELSNSLQGMGVGSQPSLWEELRDNSTPLLFLVGELDEKFVNINKRMTSICKLAYIEIINNCGHNIHFESSMLFVQAVRRFLQYA